ncbi:MAG: hypothetical protein ACKVY0_03840 [Prosthecobacter sp.]|uniref:hypothetical protein n=1 Tax=Prosthecobacter sp. TaxID=1965333 RepID=UPI0039020D60
MSYERELKAAMQEWMIHQRDFLPLPVTPTEGPMPKKGRTLNRLLPSAEHTPHPVVAGEPSITDRADVHAIAKDMRAPGCGLREMIGDIVASGAFQEN